VGGMFSKTKLDDGSINGHDGFSIGKDVIITITCDVFEKRMLFSLSFLLALRMVNVVCYWVVFASYCLFVWYSVVDLVVKNQDLFRSVEETQVFYKQGKWTSPSAYSVW
jgi:hypothetical protein